jgi:hypothetical protein
MKITVTCWDDDHAREEEVKNNLSLQQLLWEVNNLLFARVGNLVLPTRNIKLIEIQEEKE